MHPIDPSSDTPAVGVHTDGLASLETGALVLPTFESDDLADVPSLDAATGSQTSRAISSGEFRGKLFELFQAPIQDASWHASRVILVGAGPRAEFTLDRARKVAAAAGLAARQRRVTRVGVLCRGDLGSADMAQAFVEGVTLAGFDTDRYKTNEREMVSLQWGHVVLPGGDRAVLETAATRGRVLGECSNVARALANEPGNVLTPRTLAERAERLTAAAGVAVQVLDEREIAELNMGLLLGVARGSAEPPRLIVMRHEPADAPAAPVLGLVGKGITFDTGGISIKPAEGMDRMKDDMAGGAAVIGAMRAIAMLGAPIRVVGVVPATENMPGSRAIKPGDVLHSASGKTVEVINTDAEGRLVLGDALWYAQQLGATHLVDVATLTGACVVALGKSTSGLFGTPEPWVSVVRRVADRAGDRSWPMPVFGDYFDQMKSEIADMVNSGTRAAGSITAALFVKQFAGDGPWAHFDVAGTAWSDDARPYQPKGPTGICVRTLAELAFTSAEWPAATGEDS